MIITYIAYEYTQLKRISKEEADEIINMIESTPTTKTHSPAETQILWENIEKLKNIIQRKLKMVAHRVTQYESGAIHTITLYMAELPRDKLLIVIEEVMKRDKETEYYDIRYKTDSLKQKNLYAIIMDALGL